MLKKSQNVNGFEIIDVIEMAQIIYNDGKKDMFTAIHIADQGVYTGRIRDNNEFISGGFIPKQIISKIIGGTERKIRKRKSKYY